jgi:hypothetical protein
MHLAASAAVVLGLAAGSYGVASAATGGSSSSSSSSSTSASSGLAATSTPSVQSAQQPWGHQRSDETLLSGDAATKVRDIALAKVPGATVVRVETDADGNAAYEAHLVKSDGTPASVYVDKSFNFVSVQTGGPGGGPAGAQAPTA